MEGNFLPLHIMGTRFVTCAGLKESLITMRGHWKERKEIIEQEQSKNGGGFDGIEKYGLH